MDRIVKLISEQRLHFKHFAYYLPLIDKAKKNLDKHPDISIETCKSLIEGISKSIISTFDVSKDEKYFRKNDFARIFKEALDYLSSNDPNINEDFVKRTSSLIYLKGELRTRRGDISHGKKAPKEEFSDPRFAYLIYNSTEAMLEYLLSSFFDNFLYEIEETDEDTQETVEFDVNADFNIWLDELNPIEGISFSRALFEQDYPAYIIQLDEYESSFEYEEETE